jgi:group I intron endonuclease
MQIFIYILMSDVTDGVYVGQTIRPKSRFYRHRFASTQKCDYPLYRAFRKYGKNHFQMYVIEECNSHQDANEAEMFYIAYFTSIGASLYNLTKGGDGCLGHKRSLETRRKMSEKAKGRVITPAQRVDISKTLKEHFAHKPMSQEAKDNLSRKLKGRPKPLRTAEHSTKIEASKRIRRQKNSIV